MRVFVRANDALAAHDGHVVALFGDEAADEDEVFSCFAGVDGQFLLGMDECDGFNDER